MANLGLTLCMGVFRAPFGCFLRPALSSVVMWRPTNFSKPMLTNRFFGSSQGIQDNISSLQLKKRPARKKKIFEDDLRPLGFYNVVAFATAEEYDLDGLQIGLLEQGLYEPKLIENTNYVVHAIAKIQVEKEPRELFFFREGSVVLWNATDLESSNVLAFLRKYEQNCYSESLVFKEAEVMNYKLQEDEKPSRLNKDGNFLLTSSQKPGELLLDKYAFSNAIVASVKLGIWEASLDKYIDTIEFVTEDLKTGKKIKMSREEVLRRHGELFALRHMINLSSDLLDTPDFYWENEELETRYLQTCAYFAISKRTKKLIKLANPKGVIKSENGKVILTPKELDQKIEFQTAVMNEKINHCVELMELLSTHLSDKHHVRLEWMIIILIMVEVAFETVHYIDRFVH